MPAFDQRFDRPGKGDTPLVPCRPPGTGKGVEVNAHRLPSVLSSPLAGIEKIHYPAGWPAAPRRTLPSPFTAGRVRAAPPARVEAEMPAERKR